MPIAETSPMTGDHAPRVSVIIPTYQDWDRLTQCLDALGAQTYPSHRVEILVVNNDPTNQPPPSLTLDRRTHLLTEATPGSYAARNTGIKAATGQIIAFTDSDCVPDPRWIETAVQEMCSGAERVAGHIELFSERQPPSLADAYEMLVGFDQAAYAAKGSAATANMVTSKAAFDAVGHFNSMLLSGGDMEWGFRAKLHGIGIRFSPASVVRHPTRGSLYALFKKARRVSAGASAVRELRGSRLWLLRAVLPPRSVLTIARANKLTPLNRVQLMGIAYALKLWHNWNVLLLWAGVLLPQRR